MFLRLIVRPSERVAKNRFVFHSKVAQIVHISYDFRKYSPLETMITAMRLALWKDFNGEEEIVREHVSDLADYDADTKQDELLWEYLAPMMLELDEYVPTRS